MPGARPFGADPRKRRRRLVERSWEPSPNAHAFVIAYLAEGLPHGRDLVKATTAVMATVGAACGQTWRYAPHSGKPRAVGGRGGLGGRAQRAARLRAKGYERTPVRLAHPIDALGILPNKRHKEARYASTCLDSAHYRRQGDLWGVIRL